MDQLTELAKLRDQSEAIYQRLTELEVKSGAVGAAKALVAKIANAIDFLERNGSVWDNSEALACNAWRVGQAALSEDGELPNGKAWITLPSEEKERWRQAAARFREGG